MLFRSGPGRGDGAGRLRLLLRLLRLSLSLRSLGRSFLRRLFLLRLLLRLRLGLRRLLCKGVGGKKQSGNSGKTDRAAQGTPLCEGHAKFHQNPLSSSPPRDGVMAGYRRREPEKPRSNSTAVGGN